MLKHEFQIHLKYCWSYFIWGILLDPLPLPLADPSSAHSSRLHPHLQLREACWYHYYPVSFPLTSTLLTYSFLLHIQTE